MAVFPNRAVSQTITSYGEAAITNPSRVYSQPDPGEVSRAYDSWLLTNEANKLKGKYGGACVTFARNFTKATVEDVSGVARDVRTNTSTPEVGEIVKTKESSVGHLSVLIAINDGTGTVVDSNYGWDGIIRIRTISLDDPKILGYIKIIN